MYSLLVRNVRQAAESPADEDTQLEPSESDDYVTHYEVVGTSTIEIETTRAATTVINLVEQSKQNFVKVEQTINDISEKTKG